MCFVKCVPRFVYESLDMYEFLYSRYLRSLFTSYFSTRTWVMCWPTTFYFYNIIIGYSTRLCTSSDVSDMSSWLDLLLSLWTTFQTCLKWILSETSLERNLKPLNDEQRAVHLSGGVYLEYKVFAACLLSQCSCGVFLHCTLIHL